MEEGDGEAGVGEEEPELRREATEASHRPVAELSSDPSIVSDDATASEWQQPQ